MTFAAEVSQKLRELWIDSEVDDSKVNNCGSNAHDMLLKIIDKDEYIEIIKNDDAYRLTWAMPKAQAIKCKVDEFAFDNEQGPHTVLNEIPLNYEDELWHVVIKKFNEKSDIKVENIYSEIKSFIKERYIENENRPEGNDNPHKMEKEKTEYIRDEKVKDWVLKNAKGICEKCDNEGPFIDGDGRLYLEVHHVIQLANGGRDTVNNTVAVCPNCHRALHHSRDKDKDVNSLSKKVDRLAETLI